MDVRFFFIRDAQQEGRINVSYIETESQLADIFTKALAVPRFEKLRKELNICELVEYKRLRDDYCVSVFGRLTWGTCCIFFFFSFNSSALSGCKNHPVAETHFSLLSAPFLVVCPLFIYFTRFSLTSRCDNHSYCSKYLFSYIYKCFVRYEITLCRRKRVCYNYFHSQTSTVSNPPTTEASEILRRPEYLLRRAQIRHKETSYGTRTIWNFQCDTAKVRWFTTPHSVHVTDSWGVIHP